MSASATLDVIDAKEHALKAERPPSGHVRRMRYVPDMNEWDARIEVVRGDTTLGWTFVRGVKTEALPRIGERVSFWKDLASEELLRTVSLDAAAGAKVVQVEHMIGRSSTEIVVVIRASLAPHINPSALDDLRNKEGWMPAR